MKTGLDKIKEYVEAMPITTFQRVGDWDKPHSFENKMDVHLLTNPKSVKLIHKKFAKTKYNFDLYFYNKRNSSFYWEPMVNVEFTKLKEILPEVAEAIEDNGGIQHDAIAIIFTGNDSLADAIPMTSWMIAHRMAHVLMNTDNASYADVDLFQSIYHYINILIGILRGKKAGRPTILETLTAIGTFRSAKNNKIVNGTEFICECFAQYLLTGKVKLQLPQSNSIGNVPISSDPDVLDEAQDKVLKPLASYLQIKFNSVLMEAVGKIYIL